MTLPFGRPRPRAAVSGFNGLRAFRHRNYRLFYGGQLISLIGTWMQAVAQGWLVLQLTGDPFTLGVVAAAQFMPVVLFGLFGGLIADQLPKRQTLLGTQVGAMVLALALFALTITGVVEVWHIMILAVLLGITNAVDMPTRQSFVVEMVGREDVANAVGLNSAAFNAARVVGPAVAGLTIGMFDIAIAFLVNGLSYIAVIAGYFVMRDEDLRPAPRLPRPRSIGEVGRNLAEGLEYVRRTHFVLLAVVVVGLVATFGMNFQVLIPPLAQDVLDSDAAGFGFLMAASGLGSVIAALSVAFSGRASPRILVGGALVLGLATIVLGISRSFPVSLVMMFIAGAGSIAMAAVANTSIQLSVPDELRGRVMSIYATVFAGSMPAGGLVMGAIASNAGVDVAMLLGGVLSTATALGGYLWLSRIRAERALARARAAREAVAGEGPALRAVRPR